MTTPWTRRQLLQSAALTLAARTLPAQTPTRVATPSGNMEGTQSNGIRTFRGIRYAQPPTGDRRFLPPAPYPHADQAATDFGPSAIQPGRRNTSEDCLFLNLYTPEDAAKNLPVFVWIHGGGYTGGSPNDFDGSVYARQGIVTVTIAYRLGVFGFLDWSPLLGPAYADTANNGLRDVLLALRWIQTNIAAFNGDPAKVTIGGESAGAKLIDTLLGVDQSKPLFTSAISESGGAERITDTAGAHAVTAAFAAQLKDRSPQAIRTTPAAALLDAQQAMTAAWPSNFPLRPQSGGELLPHRAVPAIAAGTSRGKRLLIGTNRDENSFYLGDHAAEPITQKRLATCTAEQFNAVLAQYAKLYPGMSIADRNIRALTAEEYWMPSMRVAQAHAKGGGTTYAYRLDETAVTGPHRGESYHGYDIGYVWNTLAAEEPTAAQHLGEQIRQAWAAFIRSGTPTADGLPKWPQWTPQQRATMILNSTSHVEQQPFEAEFRLWDGFRFD